MNKKIAYCISFALGVCLGGIVINHISKRKCEEEIASVKKTYSYKKEANPKGYINEKQPPDNQVDGEYKEIIQEKGYSSAGEMKKSEAPYIIPPYEFGMVDEFEKVSLTYYADDILADEHDQILENIEELIGIDSLQHFGEYEEDSIYVRNVIRKCDYEILRDYETYSQILKQKPYLTN